MIQRLIVYHSGLLPAGLDESASLEELSEHILYYFDARYDDGSSAFDQRRTREDAVKFVGLASALHTLPSSLKSAISCGDNDFTHVESGGDEQTRSSLIAVCTHQVHLSNSTLVFVPLEEDIKNSRGLVAVVQLLREGYSNDDDVQNRKSTNNGGEPIAIREMIRRNHTLFCLSQGGSVHHRLTTTFKGDCNGKEDEDEYVNDAIPSPKAEKPSELKNKARAASMAAAEAVAQGDLAWNKRWLADSSPSGEEQRKKDEREAMSLLRQQSFSYLEMDHALEEAGDDQKAESKSKNSYPGMSQLYDARKKYRKLTARLSTSRIDADLYGESVGASEEEILDLEKKVALAKQRIDVLLSRHPLTSVRKDLGKFYDSFLTRTRQQCSVAGECVGRCIVELLPAPGLSLQTHVSSCPPCEPLPSTVATLGRLIRALLRRGRQDGCSHRSMMSAHSVNSADQYIQAPILAVSAFYCDQLLSTNITENVDGSLQLSNEFVSIIYHNIYQKSTFKTTRSTSRADYDRENRDNASHESNGFFLQSYKNGDAGKAAAATDNDAAFCTSSLGAIYAPHVMLPLCANIGSDADRNDKIVEEKRARVAFFECNEYVFIVFIDVENIASTSATESVSSALLSLSQQLNGYLEGICGNGLGIAAERSQVRESYGISGVDLIFVDRLAHKVVLLNNRVDRYGLVGNTTSNISEHAGTTSNHETHKSENGNVHKNREKQGKDAPIGVDLGLDFRHMLASRLPLDIILALDEMMKEVRQSTVSSGDQHGASSRVIELCTFLPEGWVYCRSHQHQEMYGVFDPNLFVTLADVQKASIRIRKDLGSPLL